MARAVRTSHRAFWKRWGHHVAWPMAVAFGVYWGHATVGAFRPDYLPAPRYAASDDGSALPAYAAAQYSGSSGCGGDCSDYDLGYRWASVSDADAAGECQDASWSFRRGCLAYLRAEGHFVSAPEPADFVVPDNYAMPSYREVGGEAQRDVDLEPFEGDVLTLASAHPTITQHGSLPAPAEATGTTPSALPSPETGAAPTAQPAIPIAAAPQTAPSTL